MIVESTILDFFFFLEVIVKTREFSGITNEEER